MAKSSEGAVWAWADGAERVCADCGKEMRVLGDVAEFRTVDGRRSLRCNRCIRFAGYKAMVVIAGRQLASYLG